MKSPVIVSMSFMLCNSLLQRCFNAPDDVILDRFSDTETVSHNFEWK
ncbi:unnamed protein product [Schistosoma mattheei]|uniref:Uncharacterized protein n=1 Tax=Schistosoma mattheei TaxID=31246 RepID=A0A3P8K4U5_9TREM|nr:unnamed protein product [Schistosoma mattheei]